MWEEARWAGIEEGVGVGGVGGGKNNLIEESERKPYVAKCLPEWWVSSYLIPARRPAPPLRSDASSLTPPDFEPPQPILKGKGGWLTMREKRWVPLCLRLLLTLLTSLCACLDAAAAAAAAAAAHTAAMAQRTDGATPAWECRAWYWRLFVRAWQLSRGVEQN